MYYAFIVCNVSTKRCHYWMAAAVSHVQITHVNLYHVKTWHVVLQVNMGSSLYTCKYLLIYRWYVLLGWPVSCQCFIGPVSKLNLISRPENTVMSTENDRYAEKLTGKMCNERCSVTIFPCTSIVKHYYSLVKLLLLWYQTKHSYFIITWLLLIVYRTVILFSFFNFWINYYK